MPLLKSDLYEVLKNTLRSDLSSSPVQWLEDGVAVTVVMASGGYPGSYKKGLEITGALPDTFMYFILFYTFKIKKSHIILARNSWDSYFEICVLLLPAAHS